MTLAVDLGRKAIIQTNELDICQVFQTFERGDKRYQIVIPAEGLIEFRDALTDLLDEFGTDDHGKCDSYNSSMFVNSLCWAQTSLPKHTVYFQSLCLGG